MSLVTSLRVKSNDKLPVYPTSSTSARLINVTTNTRNYHWFLHFTLKASIMSAQAKKVTCTPKQHYETASTVRPSVMVEFGSKYADSSYITEETSIQIQMYVSSKIVERWQYHRLEYNRTCKSRARKRGRGQLGAGCPYSPC